jgi:hypothetical protein
MLRRRVLCDVIVCDNFSGNKPKSITISDSVRFRFERVGIMSKRSDMWRRAQVCMSLARATDDLLLKERYEDLAVDLARNAERERTLEILNRLETGHPSPPRYRRG